VGCGGAGGRGRIRKPAGEVIAGWRDERTTGCEAGRRAGGRGPLRRPRQPHPGELASALLESLSENRTDGWRGRAGCVGGGVGRGRSGEALAVESDCDCGTGSANEYGAEGPLPTE